MKLLISLVVALGVAVAGCSRSYDRMSQVADATRSETLILKKKPDQGAITGISIAGSGAIVGSAEVQLILGGKVYQQREISGRFSFSFGGDWYSDSAEIRYVPREVSSGSVTLSYEFRSI